MSNFSSYFGYKTKNFPSKIISHSFASLTIEQITIGPCKLEIKIQSSIFNWGKNKLKILGNILFLEAFNKKSGRRIDEKKVVPNST